MANTATSLKDMAKRTVRNFLPAHVRFRRAGRAFLRGGEKEVHELHRLVEPGTAAVDVGALTGDYAYSLCELVGPQGLVICVEPQPEYARMLRSAARSLQLPMQVVECALSSRQGEAALDVPIIDGTRESGFASLDHHSANGKSLRVALRRLDDITIDIPKRISFLKVDVEGHELEVFKGGVETLKKHRPNLLVEIEQRHSLVPIAETFDWIRNQGYTGFYLDSTRTRHPLDGFDHLANQNAVPAGRNPGVLAREYVANYFFTPL